MGVLPSLEVYRMIRDEDLVIEPFEYRQELTLPASIDLRLSARVVEYRFAEGEYLLGDEIEEDRGRSVDLKENIYELQKSQGTIFMLHEKIVLPSTVAGIVLPRSSLTRLGVSLQPTYLNPGYQGNCPVLLSNHSNFKVKIPFRNGIGPRVAQILFLTLTSGPHRVYGEGIEEKYQHDKGLPAKFHQDIDIMELLEPFKKALEDK